MNRQNFDCRFNIQIDWKFLASPILFLFRPILNHPCRIQWFWSSMHLLLPSLSSCPPIETTLRTFGVITGQSDLQQFVLLQYTFFLPPTLVEPRRSVRFWLPGSEKCWARSSALEPQDRYFLFIAFNHLSIWGRFSCHSLTIFWFDSDWGALTKVWLLWTYCSTHE